jgi:transposase-like protein
MESLKLLGVEVSYQKVFSWIHKHTKLMKNYVETIVPNVSDTWRADEVYVKVKGNMKYLFSLMDDETRYLISQEVAETKDKHDARQLFIRARSLMANSQKTSLLMDFKLTRLPLTKFFRRRTTFAISDFKVTGTTTRWNA